MLAADFTELATHYAQNRPDYSSAVLNALLKYTDATRPGFHVVDVGAGTGIWTRMLADRGLPCTAIEPNDAMRFEGIRLSQDRDITWGSGSAEVTGLESNSVDWVTMASSFHWATFPDALYEFSRILRPGGYLTILWNPRDIQGHPLHEEIEEIVYKRIPTLKRVSSGSSKHARDYYSELTSTGHFDNAIFFEGKHTIVMSHERYLGAWKSVYDIQQQAGEELFSKILSDIKEAITKLRQVEVPYKTRAWTVQKK
ncbi:MAG: class I SAM-dependent methyltransferase [Nitrospirales bacterium]